MSQYALPPSPVLTPFSPESLGLSIVALGGGTLSNCASATWPANNTALFYPFRLHTWATAYQLLFWVGATSSGNIDVGIYDSQKNLIISSGSTAMSATVNTVQELNITDTTLPPGDYLLGVVCSTTAGTTFNVAAGGFSAAIQQSSYPVYTQASALPLPNPCTPVVASTVRAVVACGIQFRPTF